MTSHLTATTRTALDSLAVARDCVAAVREDITECKVKLLRLERELKRALSAEANAEAPALAARIEALLLSTDADTPTAYARCYLTAKIEGAFGASFYEQLSNLCTKTWDRGSFGIRTNDDGELRYGDGVDATTETALWCTLEQIVEIAESGDEVPDWYQD